MSTQLVSSTITLYPGSLCSGIKVAKLQTRIIFSRQRPDGDRWEVGGQTDTACLMSGSNT